MTVRNDQVVDQEPQEIIEEQPQAVEPRADADDIRAAGPSLNSALILSN